DKAPGGTASGARANPGRAQPNQTQTHQRTVYSSTPATQGADARRQSPKCADLPCRPREPENATRARGPRHQEAKRVPMGRQVQARRQSQEQPQPRSRQGSNSPSAFAL